MWTIQNQFTDPVLSKENWNEHASLWVIQWSPHFGKINKIINHELPPPPPKKVNDKLLSTKYITRWKSNIWIELNEIDKKWNENAEMSRDKITDENNDVRSLNMFGKKIFILFKFRERKTCSNRIFFNKMRIASATTNKCVSCSVNILTCVFTCLFTQCLKLHSYWKHLKLCNIKLMARNNVDIDNPTSINRQIQTGKLV